MSPENEAGPPGGSPGDVSEEELRNILGEDYNAVVKDGGADSGTEEAAADPPAESPRVEDRFDPALAPNPGEDDLLGGQSSPPSISPVHFGQLEDSGHRQQGSIDMLLDVRLPISVELGRTEMLVKEILECGPGTVIELNKLAGEPVDVFINGRMVAQGEVVVVDEHFGVRVTNLLSPQDRVRSLA